MRRGKPITVLLRDGEDAAVRAAAERECMSVAGLCRRAVLRELDRLRLRDVEGPPHVALADLGR